MRISVKIEEVLPLIKKYLKEKYGIKDNIDLVCSSKTTFLSFDSVEE